MPPITPERWRVLSPYLDEGLDIAPDQRAAWLASIGARDAALAGELAAMLVEHEVVTREGFLDHTVLDTGAGNSPSLAGQILGAYRLVSLIGEGGSGSVWLAERADGRFQGRAAVKLLNLSLIGRSGEERFRREGTILARLRHPRIAHLVDAGVSPTRQPFLVLEHVDGQSIDRYCAEHRLTIESRLRLFLDVLEAVAHAHANLIVHRDIKPANMLVTADGQVKLLDFGIAKLVQHHSDWQPRTGDSSALSREVGRAMTPEYAAPEQLSGGDVTTATDVYALGVLLYVLLTGQHPAGRNITSPATLVRSIVVDEPSRVSDTVTSPTERRLLRGDLDAIVATALKKNPADRYASVTALADDVRRFLSREPIGARPATLRYRTATFVRRNWAAVSAFAVVTLLIGGLTVVHTRRLEAERDRSQREAAKAVKVSELLMGLLTSADPYANRSTAGEPTVRGLLDGSADQVQKELAGQPELQAEMLTMMGRTYRRLGVYDKAQRLLEQALVSGRIAFGDRHVRVAQTLHDLGVVLSDKGDYSASARSLEQALAMRRSLLGPAHADVAVTLVELGRVYQDEGLNQRAEPLQREALAIRQTVLGEEHRETAVSLSDLASVLRLKGDLSASEALLRQCLELNRRTRGAEHPNTSTTMHDLALIAATRGDYRAAETELQHVLSMQRRTLGPHHPVAATTLNNLARVQSELGRYEEAAASLDEALGIVRPALGDNHQLVAIYTLNRAAVDLARKRPGAAEALVRNALPIRAAAPGVVPSRRRTFFEDDWSLGAAKSLLGATLVSLARYDEAEATLLEARRDLESTAGARPADSKVNLTRLVELYAAWGKPDVAAKYRGLL